MENLEKAMYQKMLEQAMSLLEKLANKEVSIASLKKDLLIEEEPVKISELIIIHSLQEVITDMEAENV